MVQPLRHRQTKGAATAMFYLKPPRHISTLPKTVLTPLKWDVCITTESRHRSGYAADCDVIVCYDGAKVADKHLASTVHCVDDEIIGWLKRREQRRRDRPCPASFPRTVKCSR